MDSDLRAMARHALTSDDPLEGWRARFQRWRSLGGSFQWRAGDRLMLKEVESPWFVRPTSCVLREVSPVRESPTWDGGEGYVVPEAGSHAAFKPGFVSALKLHGGAVYVTRKDLDNSIPLPPVEV